MLVLIEYLPWPLLVVLAVGGSAFFSASEAALFSLRARERTRLLWWPIRAGPSARIP